MEIAKKCTKGYRYAFNGKEKITELTGDYDFGNRIYDPRLGRFLSIDNFTKMYPFQSPYSYAANNPIIFLDAGGDSITVSRHIYEWKNGEKKFVRTMGDEEFDAFKTEFITQLQTTTNDELAYRGNVIVIIHLNNKNPGINLKEGTNLIRQINRKGPDEKNATIIKSDINYTHYTNHEASQIIKGIKGIGSNTEIEYNPSNEFAVKSDPNSKRPPIYGAIHEFIHSLHGMTGTRDKTLIDALDPHTGKRMNKEEFNTRTHENKIRAERGVNARPVTLNDKQNN